MNDGSAASLSTSPRAPSPLDGSDSEAEPEASKQSPWCSAQ